MGIRLGLRRLASREISRPRGGTPSTGVGGSRFALLFRCAERRLKIGHALLHNQERGKISSHLHCHCRRSRIPSATGRAAPCREKNIHRRVAEAPRGEDIGERKRRKKGTLPFRLFSQVSPGSLISYAFSSLFSLRLGAFAVRSYFPIPPDRNTGGRPSPRRPRRCRDSR